MKKIFSRLLCLSGVHDWTSKSMQGIKPTEAEVDAGMAGFREYAKMYCSICKKESKFNETLK